MVFDYESIADLLKAELRRRMQLNPRYSLRSFARQLRLSPGALSEVLRGKRELSVRSVGMISQAIGLNATEVQHVLHLVNQAKLGPLPPSSASKNERRLSEEIFNIVSQWYHFAILNLLECEGFQWKPSHISKRLGISSLEAKLAMDLLVRFKLVLVQNGKAKSAHQHVLSSSEIPSEAIREYHRQVLAKAAQALDYQTFEQREISGIGFATDPAHLSAMKKEIAEFQDRLLAKYSRGKKTEVYFLETALFKLTQENGK